MTKVEIILCSPPPFGVEVFRFKMRQFLSPTVLRVSLVVNPPIEK